MAISMLLPSSNFFSKRGRRTKKFPRSASTRNSEHRVYPILVILAHQFSSSLHGRGLGQIVPQTGSFLKDIELFDYLEFGMTSKDARASPVSTRKLLEVSFLPLLDSGVHYRGQNVGCFMSGVAHDIYSVSGHVSFLVAT